ncbi:hypothetical protein CTAYLR_003859 [Chrysophaeum taylorii]|uniref:Major facilitator superfamily (MFS) profile domain-containing protein n=1 Tax=Chrysophaeum taylorii TaxID=2483200 RepID=A0AAD7UL34_9STRA|nr:hypothetical protein CTAYLR_003859 [Chrysophaeum taylorii]
MNAIAYERVTQEVKEVELAAAATILREEEEEAEVEAYLDHQREASSAKVRAGRSWRRWCRVRRVRTVRRLREVALSLYASQMLLAIARLVPQTLVPAVGESKFGLKPAQIGLATSFVGVGKVAGNVPAASLQRRLGDKTTMVCGGLLFVVAGATIGFARGLVGLCAGFGVTGLYLALFQVGRQSWCRVMFKTEVRGGAMGLLGGLTRVASVLAPAAAGVAAGRVGARVALASAPAVALAGTVLTLGLPTSGRRANDPPTLLSAYKAVVLTSLRELAATATFGLLIFWIRTSRELLVPLAAVHARLRTEHVGYVVAASYFADAAVGLSLAGRVMDSRGRRPAACLSCAAFAIGFGALGSATAATGVVLASMLVGAGNGFASGLVMTISTDLAPEDNRGAFLSLFRLVSDLGIVVGADVSGFVADSFSLRVSCHVVAGIALFSFVFVLLAVPETLGTRDRVDGGDDDDAKPPPPLKPQNYFFPQSNNNNNNNSNKASTANSAAHTSRTLLGAAATLTRSLPSSRAPAVLPRPNRPADAPTYSIIDEDEEEEEGDDEEDPPFSSSSYYYAASCDHPNDDRARPEVTEVNAEASREAGDDDDDDNNNIVAL